MTQDIGKIAAAEYRVTCKACDGEGRVEHRHMPIHNMRSVSPEFAMVGCEDCHEEGEIWTDAACTLEDCPPGLFMFGDCIGLKTEYRAMESVGLVEIPGDQIRWKVGRWPDAYVVASGEVFWGGTSRHEDRAARIVQPVEIRAHLIAQEGSK